MDDVDNGEDFQEMSAYDVQTLVQTEHGEDAEEHQRLNQAQERVNSHSDVSSLVEKGRLLAKTLGCGFALTSSRTGLSVQETFEEMARMILRSKGHLFNEDGYIIDPANPAQRLSARTKRGKRSSCCGGGK